MQRFYEKRTDQFGNPASGLSCTVYLTGTTTLATLFVANSSSDTVSTGVSNPLITTADGIVAFAIADGDYDFVFVGADGATEYRYRVNFFDSTTATTIPVSSISITMPAEYVVTGSPGTTISVAKDVAIANTVYAGPTGGADAIPAFRALVADDLSPVALVLTGPQSVSGNKSFSGTTAFNGAVSVGAFAVTMGATLSVAGTASLLGNVLMEKTSKFQVDSASPSYPWMTQQASMMIGATTGTMTVAVFQGTIYLPSFSASAKTALNAVVEVPNDYEAGTDIHFYCDWSSAGTNTGTARHGWEYSIAKAFNQEPFPAPSTVYVETAAQGTIYQCMTSTSAAISGASIEAGSKISFNFFRDGAHGNDSLTNATWLHGLGIRYQASRPGTKNQTPPFYS